MSYVSVEDDTVTCKGSNPPHSWTDTPNVGLQPLNVIQHATCVWVKAYRLVKWHYSKDQVSRFYIH